MLTFHRCEKGLSVSYHGRNQRQRSCKQCWGLYELLAPVTAVLSCWGFPSFWRNHIVVLVLPAVSLQISEKSIPWHQNMCIMLNSAFRMWTMVYNALWKSACSVCLSFLRCFARVGHTHKDVQSRLSKTRSIWSWTHLFVVVRSGCPVLLYPGSRGQNVAWFSRIRGEQNAWKLILLLSAVWFVYWPDCVLEVV